MTSIKTSAGAVNALTLTQSLIVMVSLGAYVSLTASHTEAKVRPSDISYPTNVDGLGRGYEPPGAIFDISLWGGISEVTSPYKSRSHAGLLFEARSPFSQGELGFRFGMFNHSVEFLVEEDGGLYSSNLSLDWRWRGGERGPNDPFIGIGIALPTRKLSGEGGVEGESQLDAFRVALASRFGGFDRWMWEPNTSSAFVEAGGRSQWGGLIIEGEAAVAYLYRVAESTEVESANLFAQASGGIGIAIDTWALIVGGGYAISPLSTAEDVDQLHGRVKMTYSPNQLSYYVSMFIPVDAPMGVIDGEMGWALTLGMVGQL
jgi:hypothetical protein